MGEKISEMTVKESVVSKLSGKTKKFPDKTTVQTVTVLYGQVSEGLEVLEPMDLTEDRPAVQFSLRKVQSNDP